MPDFIFRCRGDALAVRTGPVLPSAPMQLQGVANRLGAMMGWIGRKQPPKKCCDLESFEPTPIDFQAVF